MADKYGRDKVIKEWILKQIRWKEISNLSLQNISG